MIIKSSLQIREFYNLFLETVHIYLIVYVHIYLIVYILASLDSMLMEDHGNLGRAIDLVRIVVDLDDCFFCFFPPDFCLGWFGSQMLVVAGSALIQFCQYTRYRYFGMFLFVFPNRSIEDTSRYLPSILIAFFNTFSASCVSLSSFLR